MPKTRFILAFAVWLVVVSLAIGCDGTFRPEVPFVGDKGVRLCMMTVHPISWEPYPTPTSLYRADATHTPLPTRTLAPNAQMPNRVTIERGGIPYASRVLQTDRTWTLEDATKVAQLYCTILTLPSSRPSCPDSFPGRTFRMQFKRDEALVDDFLFTGFGCSNVYLDLDPVMRADGRIYVRAKSDMRYTNGCFWKYLAETLNEDYLFLPAPTRDEVAIATREAIGHATLVADAATATAARATEVTQHLTTTPESMPRALTRQARMTEAAQTQTSTPSATAKPKVSVTVTPPFPVVQSNCQ